MQVYGKQEQDSCILESLLMSIIFSIMHFYVLFDFFCYFVASS